MDWIARLNRCTERMGGRLPLGDSGCAAEVLHWAYAMHLRDNVPHRHTYFEVCLVGAHGAGEYRVGGVPHPLTPGTLFFARPGVVHQIVNTAAPEMELYWVAYRTEGTPGSEIGALLDRFADAATVLAVSDTDGRVGGLWHALRGIAGGPPLPGTDIQLRQMMAALLLALAQAGAGIEQADETEDTADAGASAALARRAVRIIHDRLAGSGAGAPTVSEIAREVGLSVRHLSRVVRAFTGVSPAEYIEQTRLHRAATLLVKTDDPIKQVAQMAGYTDVHHFTRAFRRVYGCPPGAFRQRGGPLRAAHPDNIGALV